MKRHILFSLLIWLSISSHGQTIINNVLTDQHQQVLGTKYFIVPPADFEQVTNFNGFFNQLSQSSVLFATFPSSFTEMTAGFTTEALKAKGMTLIQSEKLKLNGFDAILLTNEQEANGRKFLKYNLLFGNETLTTMINGTFLAHLKDEGEEIKASMKTVVYVPELDIDPLVTAPFSIDVEGTKLKFAYNLSGAIIYTVDGNLPIKVVDKTSFIISPAINPIEMENRRKFAIDRLKKLPYKNLTVIEASIEEVIIDDLPGYAIQGQGINKNGIKEYIYFK